jgi:uncharacterized membrane protein YkgB
MRRALLILLGLLVVTWFEFQVYPGHSYLQGETQLLVPMLERLDTPGFLSRDLVAANPTFAYTIYDEITQSLHIAAKVGFEQALMWQQLAFRLAAVIGIFLLARALKVVPWAAILISGCINAITHLATPEAFVTNPEATPASFALGLVFLAAGLLVNRNALLAGLAAGFALLYDPITAAPFWLIVIIASLTDRSLRTYLRPAWLSLVIFSLILGNLVQLQAGLGGGEEVTARMSAAMVQLTRIRTPWVWVTHWVWNGILTYKFLLVAGVCALARLWKFADRITKWVTIGLAASGTVSVGVAMILLLQHSQFAVEMMPARNLAFSVSISVLLCGAASWHAAQKQKWVESLPWMAVMIFAILNAQVLDLLHLKVDMAHRTATPDAVRQLASWAEHDTWGSSLFQFMDAGKSNEPGIFRARSKRALWADWESGLICESSDEAGHEWYSRWQSRKALPEMLRLPIDYYVLDRQHELTKVKPVYENSEYVVYDAQDLRESPNPL